MTSNRIPTVTELNNVKQDTVQWPAKAHRTFLVNEEGNNAGLVSSNEGDNLRTSNPFQEQLLVEILKQLKITNLHLSIITDNNINEEDIN